MGKTSVSITIRVYPSAARNEVAGFSNGAWHIRISAPPVRGKANRELISFLSKVLGVGKDSISIVRGHTNRIKLLAVDGVAQGEITKRLSYVSVR